MCSWGSRPCGVRASQRHRRCKRVGSCCATSIRRCHRWIRAPGSREYRESLAFLRSHASEATAEVGGLLLEEGGGFGKWQLTYLVGEFGDDSAIALLRLLADQPLPEPQPAGEGRHEIDLVYTEEIASRVQAVMSTARIASLRPNLREQRRSGAAGHRPRGTFGKEHGLVRAPSAPRP